MNFKAKTKKEKVTMIVIAACVFLLVLISIFAGVLFPGSTFEAIVNNSVGKFFNIVDFFTNNYVKILESLSVIFFIWLITLLMTFIISLLMKKNSRSETVGTILRSMIRYLAILVALFLILSAWGVETRTLLAGAGILGLALSFGAQSLIEDVISGLFLIFEKQFQIGDVIQIGDFRGTVLEIGIRVTKFEDINGDIKIVNNSDIRGAINTSADLSAAICDISISYSADLVKVEKIIKDNLSDIKSRIPDIIEGPHYRGVQELGSSSVVIRIYSKSHEKKKYQVVRDLNREMKLLFDKNGIEIPFPQVVVHQEKPKAE
ncbi:MAG: mechanosensitive ion channel protein MscS [Tenericutes bacterium HGW-Tenericutes-1]|jgi:small conductance mechanosensitive channel|nr:MAG: mechanosensitive ion channel protein MscS [Tenericutes bacterium HGW-Tenericutes-1]